MAAINFVKGEQYYTAEFQINGPVNVHIERAEAGALYFRQRSIDHGSYDLINGANWNNRGDLTIDTAIQGVVYPMWIKIESASEPTLAEMVEGEQSGGGAGNSGGGNENTYKYIDVRELAELKAPLIMYSLAVRVRGSDNYTMPITSLLTSMDSAESVFDNVMAVMLDLSFVLDLGSDGKFETREMFTTMGIDLSSLPHLTKEEFYNLEA